MTIIVISILALLALAFIAQPLFNSRRYVYYFDELLGGGRTQKQLNYLQSKKALVYDNIKDLELEHQMGKLSDADFDRLRAGLMLEAEQVVKEIDEAQVKRDIEELIEKDARSHRKIKQT
jgi:hypothetical protein